MLDIVDYKVKKKNKIQKKEKVHMTQEIYYQLFYQLE
jgi:hypothetical protein